MSGAEIVAAIGDKLSQHNGGRRLTEKQIAAELGISFPTLRSWKRKNAESLSSKQVANLIMAVRLKSEKEAYNRAIYPIVEYFPIDTSTSRGGNRMEIFSSQAKNGQVHPYLGGLKGELKKHKGVYIFHDSSGRSIYVGKAVKRTLWGEIKSAFNRHRGEIQSIYRVNHPDKNYKFKTNKEKARQIRKRTVRIFELAAYMSAYSIPSELIGKLEALMVRGFANDLLNARMERFSPRARPTRSRRAMRNARAKR